MTDKADKTAHRALRPKDAASVILIDREGRDWRMLMGRRSSAHVFMPDLYVFPGGRRDAADGRVPVNGDLHPAVQAKLAAKAGSRMTPSRARALGVAAVRETHEETGLALTRPEPSLAATGAPQRLDLGSGAPAAGLSPDLSRLRYVARAITPPGRPRRYDTRFFACFIDEFAVHPEAACDSAELSDLRWVGFADLERLPLPDITRLVLAELHRQRRDDGTLPFGAPVPWLFERHGRAIREII